MALVVRTIGLARAKGKIGLANPPTTCAAASDCTRERRWHGRKGGGNGRSAATSGIEPHPGKRRLTPHALPLQCAFNAEIRVYRYSVCARVRRAFGEGEPAEARGF